MDELTLRKFQRPGAIVDKKVSSLKKLVKSKSLPTGNTNLSSDGLAKTERTFLEFYINDEPLSKLLDKFYGTEGAILDNWIGVLGWSVNMKTDVVKVKRLLGKNISDEEIRQMYPAELSDNEFQNYLEDEREELSDPEIIIYCCPVCGDYQCGGIPVLIERTDDAFVWTFRNEHKHLTFKFDRYKYFDFFDRYLRSLKVIQHSDLETREKYLPMLREAVKNGKALSMHLALLEDRVALGQGKKQIYGSQIHRDQKTGQWFVAPIEDEKNVNTRRASVGLEPLEVYLKHWNIDYKIPQE